MSATDSFKTTSRKLGRVVGLSPDQSRLVVEEYTPERTRHTLDKIDCLVTRDYALATGNVAFEGTKLYKVLGPNHGSAKLGAPGM